MERWMRRPGRGRSRAIRLSLLASVLASGCGFQEPALQPITREPLTRVEIPPIPGRTAAMDVIGVAPAPPTLYVADATDPSNYGIDVIDVSTAPGRYLRPIRTGDAFPNGLVIAPDVQRLYAAVDDSTVQVVDLNPASPTYRPIPASVSTGGQLAADLIDYDSRDHKVYVANPDDGLLTPIDSP